MTPDSLVAEMLAAGLNANVGGRDQTPLEVEGQVVRWMRELFAFPDGSSGIFVTGTSIANFIGLLVALTKTLGPGFRRTGLGARGASLVAYCSDAAHGSLARAMSMAGLGTDALRRIGARESILVAMAGNKAGLWAIPLIHLSSTESASVVAAATSEDCTYDARTGKVRTEPSKRKGY